MAATPRSRKIDSAAQRNWRSPLARLEGAYSEATLAAIAPIWKSSRRGAFGRNGGSLPAAPETVAAFVAFQAQTCAAATIKRRLAAIRKVHRVLRLENPELVPVVCTGFREG